MEELIEQIRKALEAKLYYIALFSSLAIPDICGSMEVEDPLKGNVKDRYTKWFLEYVVNKNRPMNIGHSWAGSSILPEEVKKAMMRVEALGVNGYRLSPDDCYRLRCSFLHQGLTVHPDSGYSRIVFYTPENSGNMSHMNVTVEGEDAFLNIDVVVFCEEIINGLILWLVDKKSDGKIQARMQSLVRYYPNGIPQFPNLPLIT